MMVFGIALPVLFGQLLVGLINGSFYALLSLGLAVVFGLLHVINFAHGAFYMIGAFAGWLMLTHLGIGYWGALVLAPLAVGLIGATLERALIARQYGRDPLYGLLLTLGAALVFEGAFLWVYGTAGLPYRPPAELQGAFRLSFMTLPQYRVWVVVVSLAVCLATWLTVERSAIGARLRAATENAVATQSFGIDVPALRTLTYTLGAAISALAGILAAPIYQVSPLMGHNNLIAAFAVVVIGGMGSIAGAIVSGYALGLIEGLTRLVYPEAANVVVFFVMVMVLLVRPGGLFGKSET